MKLFPLRADQIRRAPVSSYWAPLFLPMLLTIANSPNFPQPFRPEWTLEPRSLLSRTERRPFVSIWNVMLVFTNNQTCCFILHLTVKLSCWSVVIFNLLTKVKLKCRLFLYVCVRSRLIWNITLSITIY